MFRVCFGLLLLWEVWRYVWGGWIAEYYIEPEFHFTYPGFGWVQPWAGDGMYLHFFVLGVLAVGIIVGCFYRLCAALFFLGITYVFLLEQARYLNHIYLVCLLSLLMVFIPAHRSLSIDALRRPEASGTAAPTWALWLLRFQIGIVYVYGALAKLQLDWLTGWPMRMWLPDDSDVPIVGALLRSDAMPVGMSWAGMLFDLLIVPALLWRRTRIPAFVTLVAFHVLNAHMFRIGIFPWLGVASALLFFPPDWPRKVFNWPRADTETAIGGPARVGGRRQRLIVALLVAYGAVQLLVPLRHHLYPGNVLWTEEGLKFAWHMKLRDKSARTRFRVTDPASGVETTVDPRPLLTNRQYKRMASRPHLLHAFALHLAEGMTRDGVRPQIWAHANVSVNGRRHQLLIDPTVDLAAEEPRVFSHAPFILPLTARRKDRKKR